MLSVCCVFLVYFVLQSFYDFFESNLFVFAIISLAVVHEYDWSLLDLYTRFHVVKYGTVIIILHVLSV